MNTFYTSEKHIQLLIALLKAHKIKKVIVSPGATNVTFVASIQNDNYFEIYSAVDERSAAYMACGMAEETGEVVVLSCTGATASRNYMPGLTEAYYRKLPILAVTSTQPIQRIGHNVAQVIDRTVLPKDIAKHSVYISSVNNADDEYICQVNINNALLEIRNNGDGPVHINLETKYERDYSVKKLPKVNVINRITMFDKLPKIKGKKIAIYVGAHSAWDKCFAKVVDEFCEKYNAVVLFDHTSNYNGKYGVLASTIATQKKYKSKCCKMDILIDIGNISGAYFKFIPEEVWRVNEDGVVRDLWKKLKYIFSMSEMEFFKRYNDLIEVNEKKNSYFCECVKETKEIQSKLKELPFSNPWIAQQTVNKLPKNSVIHFGILNSLRSWNYFDIDCNVRKYANTGGFGIDGCCSSLVGAAISNKDTLFFGVVGDLAFFYDLNVMGNRHIGNNLRIMIINNGRGTEFRNEIHLASRFEDNVDKYIAAAGHFGNKSRCLVKNFVEDLGYKYLSAKNKEEYMKYVDLFTDPNKREYSIVFEIFTDYRDESDAISMLCMTEDNVKNKK